MLILEPIGVLVAMAAIKTCIGAVQSRSGTGGISLAVREVGRFKRTALPQKDVGQTPSAHSKVGETDMEEPNCLPRPTGRS